MQPVKPAEIEQSILSAWRRRQQFAPQRREVLVAIGGDGRETVERTAEQNHYEIGGCRSASPLHVVDRPGRAARADPNSGEAQQRATPGDRERRTNGRAWPQASRLSPQELGRGEQQDVRRATRAGIRDLPQRLGAEQRPERCRADRSSGSELVTNPATWFAHSVRRSRASGPAQSAAVSGQPFGRGAVQSGLPRFAMAMSRSGMRSGVKSRTRTTAIT